MSKKKAKKSLIDIDISCQDERWHDSLANVEDDLILACEKALNATDILQIVKEIEISVLLADDNLIQKLNKEYREIDKPTNVLSFPLTDIMPGSYDNFAIHQDQALMLGDMAFAYETIKREAEEQNKSIRDHFIHLVIHSTLHLLGYDHEINEEAEIMEKMEIAILASLGIKNPYENYEIL